VNLLFVGPLWEGSTALQRMNAFRATPGISVTPLDSMERVGSATLVDRLRHRLRLPGDKTDLNRRLVELATRTRPGVVFVDSTRVLARNTIRTVKQIGARVAFYSPDDVSQPHNSSRRLESCDREWDVFFTTKAFNVEELRKRGVRRPILVGNSFDPDIHRPLTRLEAGPWFEQWDAVFAGTFENARLQSINRLAREGVRVVVYGNPAWSRRLDRRVRHEASAYAGAYTGALHSGLVALAFLRKLNRDAVTTRSVEIPAAGRPMIAEKTPEHDQMFDDGSEYVSFSSDDELVWQVARLKADAALRQSIARAGRLRCLSSGYSTLDRARQMRSAIEDA
jgi:spore maturation protein CgeB